MGVPTRGLGHSPRLLCSPSAENDLFGYESLTQNFTLNMFVENSIAIHTHHQLKPDSSIKISSHVFAPTCKCTTSAAITVMLGINITGTRNGSNPRQRFCPPKKLLCSQSLADRSGCILFLVLQPRGLN